MIEHTWMNNKDIQYFFLKKNMLNLCYSVQKQSFAYQIAMLWHHNSHYSWPRACSKSRQGVKFIQLMITVSEVRICSTKSVHLLILKVRYSNNHTSVNLTQDQDGIGSLQGVTLALWRLKLTGCSTACSYPPPPHPPPPHPPPPTPTPHPHPPPPKKKISKHRQQDLVHNVSFWYTKCWWWLWW